MPNFSINRQAPVLLALGEAIRAARLVRHLSQERLALLADIDRSYLGRIERGDNNVALLTLLKISVALDLSAAELLASAGL